MFVQRQVGVVVRHLHLQFALVASEGKVHLYATRVLNTHLTVSTVCVFHAVSQCERVLTQGPSTGMLRSVHCSPSFTMR